MSDSEDTTRETESSDEPQGPLCGERLAEARRAQQITVLEIAKELHLDEPKVRALERNEFEMLGAAVFAKGHMRKYAQLVQVDEGDVLADYYQLTRSSTIPPVVSARPRPRREMSPGPWIAVIVAVIIAATAYYWFTSRPASVETPQQDLLPQETTPLPERDPALDIIDDSAAPESAVDEAPAEIAAPAPVVDDGQMRMQLTYSGDCWTEITDANGRRLFFDMGTSGRTVELSGEAPFNVLFGNVDNVSVQVNGADYAISATERRGLIARLTISGT